MIRVAVNATLLGPAPISLATYTIQVLRRLRNESWMQLVVYSSYRDPVDDLGLVVRSVPFFVQPRFGKFAAITRFLWTQFLLPGIAYTDRVRLVYSPSQHGSCFLRNQVVTVHDIIPLLIPKQRGLQTLYYKLVLGTILRRAGAIITVSNSTARDIVQRYGVPHDKVFVVYPGVDHDLFKPQDPHAILQGLAMERQRYFIAVGTNFPNKNLERLLRSFVTVLHELPGVQLAIVGGDSPYRRQLAILSEDLGLQHAVRFLGYQPLANLPALYSGAIALVYPSLYEGFGLPPLEAMACGCPVIASNVASLPEVCGDAALLVDPLDVREIANAMIRLATDPGLRQGLRERGLARASQFTWEKTAAGVAAVLAQVAGGVPTTAAGG